jgi:hypothetical protein
MSGWLLGSRRVRGLKNQPTKKKKKKNGDQKDLPNEGKGKGNHHEKDQREKFLGCHTGTFMKWEAKEEGRKEKKERAFFSSSGVNHPPTSIHGSSKEETTKVRISSMAGLCSMTRP